MNRPICIIDDDNDVREVLCFALEHDGIDVISFASAVEAESAMGSLSPEEWPCLIIVDYMMPEMDGVSFINLLKEKYPETIGKIPVALNTARIPDENDNISDDVILLEKPLELELLLSTARKYYQKGEAQPSSGRSF